MARLIFITGTPAHTSGGSGTWIGISVLRDAIVALGHEVELIAPPASQATQTMLSRLLVNLRAARGVRRMRADAIIGFDLDGLLVPRGAGRHIASIKGVLADEARHERGLDRLSLRLQSALEARHVRHADLIVTTSDYSAAQLARHYAVDRARIVVVPELIDLAGWESALAAAPVEDRGTYILSVAHLYPRKGTETLLRAVAMLPADVALHVVGDGPERPHLERLVTDLGLGDRVQLLGHLPLPQLMAEYRNATLFALPSEQEGFGIVFLEAMASALPVVAAHAAAVPEVVLHGVTGLLTPVGDAEALAAAMRRVLDDPVLCQALGGRGREEVARYDTARVARQFLAAIGMAPSIRTP